MKPLTQLTGVPYAMNVPDKSITMAKLADDVLFGINNSSEHTPTIQGVPDRIALSDGAFTYGPGAVGTASTLLHGTTPPSYNPVDLATEVTGTLPVTRGGTGGNAGSWLLAGNFGTVPTSNFIGTTDAVSLLIEVNSLRVMEYSIGTGSSGIWTSPNVLGGYQANIIGSTLGVSGATIAGGGGWTDSHSALTFNTITSDFASIGGGSGNFAGRINDNDSNLYRRFQTIGGGVRDTAIGDDATIGGGEYNKAFGDESTIGGGSSNTALGWRSVVGGGFHNFAGQIGSFVGGGDNDSARNNSALDINDAIVGGLINTINIGAPYSFIGGGAYNMIDTGSAYAMIGGGKNNTIQTHSYIYYGITYPPIVSYSVVGGGLFNQALAPYNVIAGGDSNIIGYDQWNSSYSFIGGGQLDTIDPGSPNNVVCGGWKNHNGGGWSLMGAGARNYIYDNSICDLIGAGRDNFIGNQTHTPGGKGISFSSIVSGDTNKVSAGWSGILAGKFNLIANDAEYSILGGGLINTIDTGSIYSTLGGGLFNQVRSPFGVINGGDSNLIDLGVTNSVIGGGFRDSVNGSAIYSTISGGDSNRIKGIAGVIGGGSRNLIDRMVSHMTSSADWGTIGGGYDNVITMTPVQYCDSPVMVMPIYATIGGGGFNLASGHLSTVIGGYKDSAYGMGSTILGGWHLQAFDWEIVGGRYNRVNLTGLAFEAIHNAERFIADSTFLPYEGSFLFILGNGTSDTTRSNAFTVSQNGHSTAYQVHGSTHTIPSGGPSMLGSTFSDNVLLAAGDVDPTGVIHTNSDFGVLTLTQAGGLFTITISVLDPATNGFVTINSGWITATLVDTSSTNGPNNPGMITVSPMGTYGGSPNSFIVKTYNCSCSLAPKRFMFHVFGRVNN